MEKSENLLCKNYCSIATAEIQIRNDNSVNYIQTIVAGETKITSLDWSGPAPEEGKYF